MSLHIIVVLVGFRNPGDVVRCLTALAASLYDDFEVLICENGGREAYQTLSEVAPARLKGGQPVRILLAPGNLGYGGGVNVCINHSRDADAWFILNPDTEPEIEALGALADRLAQGECDAVGGIIYRPSRRVQSYGGRWRPWLARAESIGLGKSVAASVIPADVEKVQSYINGAAMLVSRSFVERAGVMREDYFLYCEEVEWCLRAKRKGIRLGFAAGARICHQQGATTGAGGRLASAPRLPVYLNERNRLLLTRDCFPRLYPLAVMSALGLLVLRYVKVGAWRQLGFALAGWRAGVRNERGAPSWVNP